MSIIERALGKLQQAQARPDMPSPPPAAPRSGQRSSTSRRDLTGEHAALHSKRERRVPTETVKVSLDKLRAGGALPPEEHIRTLTDQFRRIKWPILEAAFAPNQEGRVSNRVMVTSSVAAEGKTYTSFNLAQSIAREKDFSVLFVDADVAKRHATELFNLEDHRGLTDAIADPTIDAESLVIGTDIAGLAVLPSGRRTNSAPELFASQRMVDIVQQLGQEDPHRIVLFDSSPLLVTNESQVLSKIIDQIVMVVRAEYTPQPMVVEAVSLLDKTKLIRCVLNQARASRMTEYYYGYGYYPNNQE
jgi:protein-tyrosine kinase